MGFFPFIRLLPSNLSIDFLGWRRITLALSVVLIAASVGLFVTRGLNLGIDFRGGVELAARFDSSVDLDAVRLAISEVSGGDATAQGFGAATDVLVRAEAPSAGDDSAQAVAASELTNAIWAALDSLDDDGQVERLSNNFVGGAVSDELFQAGMIAIALALSAVAIYIWFRFEWQFALAALAALSHDVITTIGLFALLQIEFNLYTTAAILTIAGYSINDTVVVFDRAREELRRYKETPIIDVLNKALNGTLTRTVITSVTTLLAVGSLAIFGGPIIQGLAIALIWGVLIGTYSSIFFATPLLTLFNLRSDVFEKKAQSDATDYAANFAASLKDEEEEEIRKRSRETSEPVDDK